MARMSKTQRIAVLDFHNGVTAKRHTMIANERTIAALVRHGWAIATPARYRTAYVTTAGLLAAGVDMDAIHAEARLINQEWDDALVSRYWEGATAGMDRVPAFETRQTY